MTPSIKKEQTTSADLGHAECPICGQKQNHDVKDMPGYRHCAHCGNIFQ